jgi:hypothetical protein
MLRLSCPAPWAEVMVRHSLLQDQPRPAPAALFKWQHPAGMHELLVAPPQIAHEVTQPAETLHLQAVPSLPADLPPVPPGQAHLWLAPDGRWQGRYRPPSLHGLQWPMQAIDELWLPGAGLHLLQAAPGPAPRPLLGWQPGPAGAGTLAGWLLAAGMGREPNGRFSRPAGVLGWDAIESLRGRRYAVVGCGRNGHAIALQLATLEPREVALFDHDRIEPGNLDAGVAFRALPGSPDGPGGFKVDALAALLADLAPATRVSRLAASILEPQALRAAAQADVLISATDDDVARFAVAVVASAFQRVHLDLGSLASLDAAQGTQLGADVRITVPGDRDLCCLGGFADGAALEVWALGRPQQPLARWQDAKAGALSSWSAMVAGLGMRLLEDLAAERLQQSHWCRMTQGGPERSPRVQDLSAAPDPYCPLCAVGGRGGAALKVIRNLAAAAVVRARRRGEFAAKQPLS